MLRALFYAAAALGLLGCEQFFGLEGEEDENLKDDPDKKVVDGVNEKAGKSPAEPVEPPEDENEDKGEDKDKDQVKEQLPGDKVDDGLLPTRVLGRTGVRVSIIGLGGSFLVSQSGRAKDAEALIERAVDEGINYIDTAPTYASSEVNIGQVMPRLRKKVFLAGKSIDRSYDGTMRIFESSLKRLQTDYLDLLQLHGFHEWSDYEQAFSQNGAYRAIEELKEQGALRFSGITSHKNPQVVSKAISDYDFDCLLFALNPADPFDRTQSFLSEALPLAEEKNMGTIAMKVASYGRIFRSGGIEHMRQALGYVLSFPVSTAIIGISSEIELEENIKIAREFKPLAEADKRKLEGLVEPYHQEAMFFKSAW